MKQVCAPAGNDSDCEAMSGEDFVPDDVQNISVHGVHDIEQSFEFQRKLSVVREREMEEIEKQHSEILFALQNENTLLRRQVQDQSSRVQELEGQIQTLKHSMSYSVSLDALKEYEELLANERVNSWLTTLHNTAKHWTRLSIAQSFSAWHHRARWKTYSFWCQRRLSRLRLHAWWRRYKKVMRSKRRVQSNIHKAEWLRGVHARKQSRLQLSCWVRLCASRKRATKKAQRCIRQRTRRELCAVFGAWFNRVRQSRRISRCQGSKKQQLMQDMFQLWSHQNLRCKYFQRTMELEESVKLHQSEAEAIMTRLHDVEADLEYEKSKSMLEYREQVILKEREIERVEENFMEKLSANLQEIRILEAANKELKDKNELLESEIAGRKENLERDHHRKDVGSPGAQAPQGVDIVSEMSLHRCVTMYKARMTKRMAFSTLRGLRWSAYERFGDCTSARRDRDRLRWFFQHWSEVFDRSMALNGKEARLRAKLKDQMLGVAMHAWKELRRVKRGGEGKVVRMRRRSCCLVLRRSFERWNEKPASICEMRNQLVRKEAEVEEKTRQLHESSSQHEALLQSCRRDQDKIRHLAGSLRLRAEKRASLFCAVTSWRLHWTLKLIVTCVRRKAEALGRRSVSRRMLRLWAGWVLGEQGEEDGRRSQGSAGEMTPREQLRAARRMVASWERLQRRTVFKQAFLSGSFIRWINELALRAFAEWRQAVGSSLSRRRVNLAGYV